MIEACRNVLVTPYESVWVGGPDHDQIPQHGRIIWGRDAKDEFPDRLREEPAPTIEGRYLYGGPLKFHFGHVMVDTIIRLWAFDRSRHDGVVFPCLDMPDPPAWFYEIVAIFGLDRSDVVVVEKPAVFRELEFAEPGSSLKNGPKSWYLDRLKSLPVRLIDDIPGDSLYFGRTHMIRKGTLMGESYFGDLLRRNGFASVRPEKFDIHAQVSMLAKARRIVFMEGSSIYSMELLASTDAELFMIPRRAAGAGLFAPHLTPKASKFVILGDRHAIDRKLNRGGKDRPDSPSFTSRPESILGDLIRHGLVQEAPFDVQAFKEAEERDTAAYFS